jgi:hypothetical protein
MSIKELQKPAQSITAPILSGAFFRQHGFDYVGDGTYMPTPQAAFLAKHGEPELRERVRALMAAARPHGIRVHVGRAYK